MILNERQIPDATSKIRRSFSLKKPDFSQLFSLAPHLHYLPANAMLDSLSTQLDQYMTLVSERQKLVASNIANADTPNYRTEDFDFEAQFQAMLHSPGGSLSAPLAAPVRGLRIKNDGNNVDLDREARLLSENAMRFNMATNFLRAQLKDLHTAIQGGGGA